MTDLVAPDRIESIVGVERAAMTHYGRAVSTDETFYILHSKLCLGMWKDLRDCPFSLALDRGLPMFVWKDHLDEAHSLVLQGRLIYPEGFAP